MNRSELFGEERERLAMPPTLSESCTCPFLGRRSHTKAVIGCLCTTQSSKVVTSRSLERCHLPWLRHVLWSGEGGRGACAAVCDDRSTMVTLRRDLSVYIYSAMALYRVYCSNLECGGSGRMIESNRAATSRAEVGSGLCAVLLQ